MRNLYYIKNSNRISDVIALIQSLALDEEYTVYPDRYKAFTEKMKTPASCASWLDIAKEHPEFFRTIGGGISLRMRLYQSNPKDTLHQDRVSELINIAIRLYDIQLNHSRGWTFWLPIVGSFVVALLAIIFGR